LLYGRGGADDGYAMFAALAALLALRAQGVPHARSIVLIEACEESGSYDLPYYVDHLAGRLGSPSLVVCVDSGCGNCDQLWLTTSLRGLLSGTLSIEMLDEGVHSGHASGVVPSSFRILRRLLSRLEDEATGAVRPAEFWAQIPAARLAQARRPPIWARAAASRSWRCSAKSFRRRSSSSPACSARTRMRTARTNFCTSRPASASRR
jgi:acetylornithine deacetylase/succinyl-diaminopimelate desuccinylase-like protein